MLFSGNTFRLTPETNKLGFDISNIYISGNGVCELGFSGQSNVLKFQFRNNIVYGPDGRSVGIYNEGAPFSLRGYFDSGLFQYSLDNDLLHNRGQITAFNVQRFFINSTGASLTSNAIRLSCPSISTTLNCADSFMALQTLTGALANASNIPFRVYDSSIRYYQTNSEDLLSGQITGACSGDSSIGFSLADLNTSLFNNEVSFRLLLNTSLGTLTGDFKAQRVSGLDTIVRTLSTSSSGLAIPILFDGSGDPVGKFSYSPTSGSSIISYTVLATDLKGNPQKKNLKISFSGINPLESGVYRSDYITGINITTGGEYLYPPALGVTGYYYANGIVQDLSSILLSSGCSGNVPVTFRGIGNVGTGGSGLLQTQKIYIQNGYIQGVNAYYTVNGFTMLSGGTGYIQAPSGILQTGIYTNCYDVPGKLGYSYSIFSRFDTLATVAPQASYFTGEVVCITGLVSGGLRTGYIVSGVNITNQGSGYNQTFLPRVSFVRQPGDTLTKNATGAVLTNQTGRYLTTGFWSIYTGISSAALSPMQTGISTGYLMESDSKFVARINYNPQDSTQNILAGLSIVWLGSSLQSQLIITGCRGFDTSTGFLKKNLTFSPPIISAGMDLSFLLSQDDLDIYYSSDGYLNNTLGIDLGDLEF